MIIDVENLGSDLKVSYFTKEGEVEYKKLQIPLDQQFVWKKTSPSDRARDKEWTSWDNMPVKRVQTNRYDKYRITEMLEIFKDQAPELWEYQTPKKYFVDIEVEMTDIKADSLNTVQAKNKILSIALASSSGKILIIGIDKLPEEKILSIEKRVNEHFKGVKGFKWIINYRSFESEFDMLYTFMAKLVRKMPVVTGWNWFGYDWPYILSRCRRLGIDPEIASPSGILIGKNEIPMHVLMIDYLEIYKKWDRSIKLKEANSLDYVGKASVGVGKAVYSGNLKELYESDFESFIFYNAVDSALLHYIDQKIATMSTFFKIAFLCGVEINRALSPVWTTEVLMLRKFLDRKQLITYERKEEEHKKFEGGYVKEPDKGLHQWIACFDFASLYPSVLRQWGISPEIFIGKNLPNPPPGTIKTNGGSCFYSKKGDEPILRGVLDFLYGKRKEAKGKYNKCIEEIKVLENAIKSRS